MVYKEVEPQEAEPRLLLSEWCYVVSTFTGLTLQHAGYAKV